MTADAAAYVCDKCGERVSKGDWPYCRSPRNPDGHTKGTYRFKMRMGMKVQGWQRTNRRAT